MGKDIHLHIEYAKKTKSNLQWIDSAIGEFTGTTNWIVFAKLLAAYGKRNIPKDISENTKYNFYRGCALDAHDYGYCSPEEFAWCVYNSDYENELNEFMALEKFIEELGKNKRYKIRIVFWFDN